MDMNQAFKVLWNRFRNSYVVASEAHASHGKSGKAAKTVLAAAVAGAIAFGGTAAAQTVVDLDYIKENGSMKFISGNGQSLVIQTEGDFQKLVSELQAAMGEQGTVAKVQAVLAALSQNDGTHCIPIGTTGGYVYMDPTISPVLEAVSEAAGFFKPELVPLLDQITGKIDKVIGNNPQLQTIVGDTSLTIGGDGMTPLMIATVGGDQLFNVRMGGSKTDPEEKELIREGNTSTVANSGNLFGVVAGSTAVNVKDVVLALSFPTTATITTTRIEGNSLLQLNGSTSTLGAVGGGAAIALGGAANSDITGINQVEINTAVDPSTYAGVTAGVLGGGLSIASIGGNSTVTTNETQIDAKQGLLMGAFGGGAALAVDVSQLYSALGEATNPDLLSALLNVPYLNKVGTAASNSNTVVMNVNGKASGYGLVGGGMAVAYQNFDATSQANASSTVNTVSMSIGEGAGFVFRDPRLNVADKDNGKEAFLSKLKHFLKEDAKDYLEDIASGSEPQIGEYQLIKDGVDALNKPGITVGVLGGGMALAYQRNDGAEDSLTTTPTATANVGSVNIEIKGGYNVGVFGSGFAAASAASLEGQDTRNAVVSVTDSNISITGGETIGVMGGGLSFFTGTGEPNWGLGAETTTTNSSIVVLDNACVDGIVGGGLAIDDTNPENADGPVTTKNARSVVENSTIAVGGNALVEMLGFSYFFSEDGKQENANNPSHPKPGLDDHLKAMTYAMETHCAAIIGGGLASGSRVTDDPEGIAHVGTVDITIGGNAQVGSESRTGNVFGGGIATNGALSSVGDVTITVQENATIKGSIYAGGIAQDTDYAGTPEYYEKSLATVDNATINLAGGTIEGSVYAGGLVSAANLTATATASKSVVKQATVNLYSATKFEGDGVLIDGSGADQATLVFKNGYAFDSQKNQTVSGFNTITADSGKVTNLAYDFAGRDTTVTGAGLVEFSSLTNADGRTLAVGTTDAAGHAAVNPFENVSGVTFKVENGFLALNSDAQSAQDAMAAAPSQAAAAAYVTGTVDLTGNLLTVGNATVAEGTIGLAVGGNGLLVADASGNTSVGGTASFAEGSSIHFVNVAQASTSGVTIGVAEQTPATTVDNVLFKAEKNADNSGYTFSKREASELGEVGLGGFDDQQFLLDVSTGTGSASDFVNSFLDQASTGVDNSNRSQQLNAAVNLATAAGVQTAAIDGAMMGIEAANKRASIINEFNDGGVLFAELSGKHFEVGGGSDFGELDADLGGLVVGGEYTTSDWTFGALANLGTGSVDGSGKNSGVENDVDYYGIEAYAAKRFGMFNLVGQVGYLMSDNDVEHHTTARNTANVDADVFTVGVRGEMRFDITDNTRVVPYVGVNYLRVSTDGYTTSQGVSVDDIDQNLWTTPIGVKFAGDLVTQSGWTWTPSADIAYIPAFGDDDVDAASGVDSAVAHTTMDVWSNSVGRLKLGVRAVKDHFGFGLEAGAATGSDDLTEYFGQVRVDYRF